jgi:cytochrome c oxidase assembly protein subunit 15
MRADARNTGMNEKILDSSLGTSRFRFSLNSYSDAEVIAFLRPLLASLTVAIFLLISLGGLVRNAGAGLSCPDWPMCYGKVIPPMDVRVFLEWFHRLIAGFISLAILGTSVLVYTRQSLRKILGTHCTLALGLLAAQVVLGGLTVLGLLAPIWVASHLAVGLAFFGVILFMALKISRFRERSAPLAVSHLVGKALLLTLGGVYFQAILGGIVSSNYAGLVCPDFPTCNGEWIPDLVGPILFQFSHRVMAVVVSVMIIGISVVLWRNSSEVSGKLRFSAMALPVLLGVQFFLGVGNVLWGLPILMSVAHLAVAALLVGTLIFSCFEFYRK